MFHLKCFTCCVCRKQLSTGEELYVLDENKFICKQDYMSGKAMAGELTGKKIVSFLLTKIELFIKAIYQVLPIIGNLPYRYINFTEITKKSCFFVYLEE